MKICQRVPPRLEKGIQYPRWSATLPAQYRIENRNQIFHQQLYLENKPQAFELQSLFEDNEAEHWEPVSGFGNWVIVQNNPGCQAQSISRTFHYTKFEKQESR